MPNARTHEKYALRYLGHFDPFLNNIIDAPSKEMKHTHRALFHDVDFLEYIEQHLGNESRLEALLHIVVDLETVRPVNQRLVR